MRGQWAVGSGQWAVGSLQLAVGSLQWAVGSGQFAVGSGQFAVCSWQLAVGSGRLAVGSGQLAVCRGVYIGMMNRTSLKNKWRILKRIFFWVFVIHAGWFVFFAWSEFSENDFIVSHLRLKLVLVCGLIILLGLVYYKWVGHIKAIIKPARVLREIFFILYIPSFLYLIWGMVFNPPLTITQFSSVLNGNGLKRDYVSLKRMSPWIKLAVIASEDQYFADHEGFDLDAIERAIQYNKKHPNRRRGGSTISQQVAKNVFLWQGGGFIRKGLEVFFTFSIEKLWTKRTILERYLNIAEMGKGVFGIGAAARIYFKKEAKDLSRAEAAQIAACLPNPKRFTVKPLSNYVANRYEDILVQMGYLEGDEGVRLIIYN